MDINLTLEPRADILIEAMRSIGYTFESAIADIVDNSISADAKKIDIVFNPISTTLAIIDDGYGMNQNELLEAMRWGSKDPLTTRQTQDLGRFGLGLKSASLSQCRRLTVCSNRNGTIYSYCWDLDIIRKTGEWKVIEVDFSKLINENNFEYFFHLPSGTIVFWENFDRFDMENSNSIKYIENSLDYASDYLAMVFHLFIEKGLKITINSRLLPKIDPFLRKSTFTQILKSESITLNDKEGNKATIQVTPYVLPHFSSLTNEDKQMLSRYDNFRSKQGFYIYRNSRLLIWGTWFRMTTNNELYKNARVKVDIPNSLDYIWHIDVKKSSATIPPQIKNKLFFSVKESIEKSEKIYTKRAYNTNVDKGYEVVWKANKVGNLSTYSINRDLPLIVKLSESMDSKQTAILELIFSNIENNMPKYEIFTDLSKGQDVQSDSFNDDFYRLCNFIKFENPKNKTEFDELIGPILNSEPYCNYPDIQERLLEVFIYE